MERVIIIYVYLCCLYPNEPQVEVAGPANGAQGGGGGALGENEDGNDVYNDPNKRTTLPQLATILDNFRNSETVNQRSKYRNDFFACFNNLDAVHRLQIPTDVCILQIISIQITTTIKIVQQSQQQQK